jgi:acetylglutamate kinase
MKKLVIVKIGGNVIDDKIELKKFLLQFSNIKENKLLVHGGGKLATQLSSKLGMETKMVEGRRITDKETLKVATMVYAGWVNKTISALLNANNCAAIGLSGADAFLIPSVKRKNSNIDYGFVGDVLDKRINTSLLNVLFSKGITPVS